MPTFARAGLALGLIIALFSSAQASMTFGAWPTGSLPSDMSVVGIGDVLISNPNLGSSNPLMSDANSVTYSESFAVTETGSTTATAGLDNILGAVSDGTLTLSATVNGTVIYTSSASNTFTNGAQSSLAVSSITPLLLGPGTYEVKYTATYTGLTNGVSYGYLNAFNSYFHEPAPTPEPGAICSLAIGVAGLVVRRRKGGK